MSDTISRQAAMDAIGTLDKFGADERCRIVRWHEGLEPYVHLRDVVTAIANLPSAQQWIPCSERPPQEGQNVLITKESFKIKGYEQEVIKAKRSADPRSGEIEWWSPEFGTLTNKAVLAWMPLPEPYMGDGNE